MHMKCGNHPQLEPENQQKCWHKSAALTKLIQRLQVNRVRQLQHDTAEDELGIQLVITGIGW